ncbi:hypothetical protein AVEN_246085-1 [Araneus ventricosus]|uniref:Uncharacterized protein n=1 Tax=Araneus ventricosus TaxID=182803 RepID=A0A4Y2MQE7_ARAVE|nr:hypothetical protein AVEN_246085-1 [Araneus ventricosus]
MFAALFTVSSRKGICISVRFSFAMLDFEDIFLKSLDPASCLAFGFLKIKKPSQESIISAEKKFPSKEVALKCSIDFTMSKSVDPTFFLTRTLVETQSSGDSSIIPLSTFSLTRRSASSFFAKGKRLGFLLIGGNFKSCVVMLRHIAMDAIIVTGRNQVLTFLEYFSYCCWLLFIKYFKILQDRMKKLFFGKFSRTSDDIHHWFIRRNNSPFDHSLEFIVQIQNSNRDGFLFQINECCHHKDTFLETLLGKSLTTYLNCPETS